MPDRTNQNLKNYAIIHSKKESYMKKIIKLFTAMAIIFMGLSAFAQGGFLNPNLDVREVRASHVLVKIRKEAVQIRKDIVNGDITFEDAARQ